MDKFGIFQLLTAFSKLYGSGLFDSFKGGNEKNKYDKEEKEEKSEQIKRKTPASTSHGASIINAMKRHDDFVKRVMKNNEK